MSQGGRHRRHSRCWSSLPQSCALFPGHRLWHPGRGLSTIATENSDGSEVTVNRYQQHHFIAELQAKTFSDKDISGAFDRLDGNKDGYLTVEDLERFFKEFAAKRTLPLEDAPRMAKTYLAKWDDDKDGMLSKDEFKRHVISLGGEVHPVIYQLSACLFLMCVPFGIIVPFEPQLVQSLNITAADFGMAQGAMFLTKFLVNVPVTDVVDRFGSKPILVASTALLGLSMGGLSMVTSLEHLIVCRVIGGAAIAGLAASLTAPLIAVQTPLNRARSGAPFQQAANAGIALGPAIGGVLSGYCGMEYAFASVGGLFLLTAATNAKIYKEINPALGSKHSNLASLFAEAFSSWSSVLRTSTEVRMLMGTQIALTAAQGGTSLTLMPLLLAADPLNFTSFMIGALVASTATLGIFVAQPLAVFADKYGRRTALGLGTGALAASMAAVPLLGSPALVSGALCCQALGQNLLAPAISALILDAMAKKDPSQMTQAMSLHRSLSDVGMVSGCMAFGALGTQYGFLAGYEASAGVVLVMGLAAFLRIPPAPKLS